MHLYTEDSWILIKLTITVNKLRFRKNATDFIQTVVKKSAKELKTLYYLFPVLKYQRFTQTPIF